MSSVLTVGTTLSTNLCRVKRSFKPYQNEHDSVKETGEKAKNHVTLTRKFPQKSCFTTHLPFLSPNPKILKAFPKTFPTKMKLTKCPAKAKNEARKAKEEERRGEKRKEKVAKFCFLGMPELYKLTFCIWIRRHRSSQSVNSFVVRFSSLYYSLAMIKKLLDYKLQNVFFGKIPRSEWVNHLPVKVGSKNMIIFIAC